MIKEIFKELIRLFNNSRESNEESCNLLFSSYISTAYVPLDFLDWNMALSY